jgi:hypothetical protein
MPAETSLWVRNKPEDSFIKIPITVVLSDVFVIDLRGNDNEHTKSKWDDELFETFACVLTCCSFSKRHVGSCAGNKK